MGEGTPRVDGYQPYPDMVYDSKAGVFIYHDIYSDSFEKTWTFNMSNNQWTRMNGIIGYYDAYDYSMAYDCKDDVAILYATEVTWIYNLTSDCWTAMYPDPHPQWGSGSSIVYDSINDAIVLFSGRMNAKPDETWTYNLSNNSWTNMNPPSSPPPLDVNDMVFDKVTGECIVFTGKTDDIWTYNLTKNTWIDKIHAAPPARNDYSIAYDESMGVVILYGGFDGANYYNDTWWYNASTNTWTNKTSIGGPQARAYQTMAYDSLNKMTVIFGGINETARFGDTWTYDAAGNTWSNKIPSILPWGRFGHSMVGDDNLDLIMMFGGSTGDIGSPWNDVWLFDVSRNEWTNRHPFPAPPERAYQSMVYDSKDGIFILFGGRSRDNSCLNDTWSYDARTDTWTDLSPPDGPSGRYRHSMAYDRINDVVVLFGGNDGKQCLGDTWLYNYSSNSWIEKNPTPAPAPDDLHQMAYDEASGLTVLASSNGTIWAYNARNNSWAKKNTVTGSCAGSGSTMVYDGKMCALVFGSWMGGFCGYNVSTDSFATIYFPFPSDSPFDYAIAYDKTSETIVFFGGWSCHDTGLSVIDSVWIYDLKQCSPSGIFTSCPFDTGGSAYFGDLRWDAVVPDGTGIKFQLRTSDTAEQLNSTAFFGPDGTVDSYYNVSGQMINGDHNGTRWLQYRVCLSTTASALTPVLKSVNIEYNLPQHLWMSSPGGGENWTGLHNITWTAKDPDNDSLTFSIYLEKENTRSLLVSDLPNGTTDWTWNTSAVPNGTYRIRMVAKDDNPSIPLTVSATSGNFTIVHPPPLPPPNHPPHVMLVSPMNNSMVNTSSVRLSWNGTDPDGDTLTFTVRYSDRPLALGNARTCVTGTEHLDLTDLADNTICYWTVDAGDGKFNTTDVPAGIWSFTIRLPHPPVNHSPRITSTPPTEVRASDELLYNLTAGDEDGDIMVFSLVTGPSNMSLDMGTGKLRWIPGTADIGNHTITVRVVDGRGGVDEQTFTVKVLEALKPPPLPEPPGCKIVFPANGSKVSGRIQIRGTARNATLPLIIVQIRMDGGKWMTAIGLENWTLSVNVGQIKNGRHTIEARAFDGNLYSETASVVFQVANPEPSVSSGGTPWCLPAIIVAVVAALGVLIVLRKKKDGSS